MKKSYAFLGALMFATAIYAQTINCEWVDFSTGYNAYCISLDIDNDDNILSTGYFDNLTIGSYELTVDETPERFDAFVLKHDAQGDIEWLNHIDNTGRCQAQHVKCDPENNVIVGGTFENTLTIADETFVSAGNDDVFITKLDDAGNYLWSRQVSGAGAVSILALDTDEEGNAYVFTMSSVLTTFNELSSSSTFTIAKYDAEGNVEWLKPSFSGFYQVMSKPLTSSSEGIYYTGSFTDTITFAGNTYFSEKTLRYDVDLQDSVLVSTQDQFLASIDAAGNEQWLTSIGSEGEETGYALTTNENFIFSTAFFSDSVSIDGGPELSDRGTFLLKFDLSGNLLDYLSQGTQVDIRDLRANEEYLYVTGSRGGEIYLDKYDLDFNLLQSFTTGGNNIDYGHAVAISPGDFVVLGGIFIREAEFGDFTLDVDVSAFNLFIAKLGADIVPVNTQINGTPYLVYPNPLSNRLYGNTNFQNQALKLRICNDLGQVMATPVVQTDAAGFFELDIAALAAGTYWVQLEYNGQITTQKIIKQ